jgi:hypothetical protein
MRPYNTKKTGGTKLISTVGSLHISLFLLHTSPTYESFLTSGIGWYCVPKKKLKYIESIPSGHPHLK